MKKPFTLEDWKSQPYKSFYQIVEVGQEVDEEVYYHFLNVLPPRLNHSNLLKAGGEIEDGKYITFERINGKWHYVGLS